MEMFNYMGMFNGKLRAYTLMLGTPVPAAGGSVLQAFLYKILVVTFTSIRNLGPFLL